jgi:hypothetical protein
MDAVEKGEQATYREYNHLELSHRAIDQSLPVRPPNMRFREIEMLFLRPARRSHACLKVAGLCMLDQRNVRG